MVGGPWTNEKSPTHIQVRLYKLEVDFLIDSVKKWTVQALAPQGDEMSLVLTLTIRTVDQRVVSPLLCGSHPYPCGSLTYRYSLLVYSSPIEKSTLTLNFFRKGGYDPSNNLLD